MKHNRVAAWLGLLALTSVIAAGCRDSRRIDYSVATLVKSLTDTDPNIRYWAAQSLGSFGAEAEPAVSDLVLTLKDENKLVRMGAAYALAEIGAGAIEALPDLREAARDPEQEVRDAAAYATEQIRAKTKG